MKTKKSAVFYVLTAFVFCILYIIFAAKPLNNEYHLIPEWKIEVSPNIDADNKNKKIPFKLAQTMGYFTEDGKITSFVSYPYRASISEEMYTFYSANSNSSVIYTSDGQITATIKESGFPMIAEEKIFMFLPGGATFARYDEKGNKLWDFGGTMPITAFASSKTATAAGFADGTICKLNEQGELIQRFAPGGSENPVILGIDVSNSGNYIAAVTGQNKQRFILAKSNGVQTKIIFHEFIEKNTPLQKLVKFSKDDSSVYYNAKDFFSIVDVKKAYSKHIPIAGHAVDVKEAGSLIFVLVKNKNTYTIHKIEKPYTLIGSFSFEADAAFIQTGENHLYIGKNNGISSIRIEKK